MVSLTTVIFSICMYLVSSFVPDHPNSKWQEKDVNKSNFYLILIPFSLCNSNSPIHIVTSPFTSKILLSELWISQTPKLNRVSETLFCTNYLSKWSLFNIKGQIDLDRKECITKKWNRSTLSKLHSKQTVAQCILCMRSA